MASRQRLVTVVASVLILVACTDVADDPTASRDVFAPTPTIGNESGPTSTLPNPTTRVPVERRVVLPVDPVTLEALDGFEPIPMGDWVWAVASSAEAYLAAWVGDDTGEAEVRLIDMARWEQVGSWPLSPGSDMFVSDEGAVYFVDYGTRSEVHGAEVGDGVPSLIAELPQRFSPLGIGHLFDGRLALFGTRSDVGENGAIAVIEIDTGTVTEIALPDVHIEEGESDLGEPWSAYLYPSPLVVWDDIRSRALVIHADGAAVSEVDLRDGSVTRHALEGEPSSAAAIQVSSALSPDGGAIHIAAVQAVVTVDDEEWSVTRTPTGVKTFDTTTWQIIAELDAPISGIISSPRGDRLLGWGHIMVEGESRHQVTTTGVFVLDAVDLEVLAHHQPVQADESYGPTSFSRDGALAYASTLTTTARLDVIDTSSGQILTTMESEGEVFMVGSIGVLVATDPVSG
jgi:hypothetical protein